MSAECREDSSGDGAPRRLAPDLIAQEMSKIRLLYAIELAGPHERAHP
jgi:hypothetical protein